MALYISQLNDDDLFPRWACTLVTSRLWPSDSRSQASTLPMEISNILQAIDCPVYRLPSSAIQQGWCFICKSYFDMAGLACLALRYLYQVWQLTIRRPDAFEHQQEPREDHHTIRPGGKKIFLCVCLIFYNHNIPNKNNRPCTTEMVDSLSARSQLVFAMRDSAWKIGNVCPMTVLSRKVLFNCDKY